MVKRKYKMVSIILTFGDEFYLERKIKYDKNYVDLFLVVDLVSTENNFKSSFKELVHTFTDKEIHYFEKEIDINSNWDNQNFDIFNFIREKMIKMDLNFDDILFFSKSNEFIDFDSFDTEDLVTSQFLLLNHKKIFWQNNFTDNRYLEGSIVMKFSIMIDDDFFSTTMDHTKVKYDTLDYINFRNGWVFFGFNNYEITSKEISYGFSKLDQNFCILDNELLSFLKNNNLPIENYDYKKIETLSLIDLPQNLSLLFEKDEKNVRVPKKIIVDLTESFVNRNFKFHLKLLPTKNILDHFKFDNPNFYVYVPTEIYYLEMVEKYLINESKKAVQIFFPYEEDTIILKTENKTYDFIWGDIKDKIIHKLL